MTQILTVAATLTAGPFGVLAYQAPQNFDGSFPTATTGLQLVAGTGSAGGAITTGLSVAGMAAVASAVNTYLSALSAAKKAQLPNPQNGCPVVSISPAGISVPVHGANVVSFTTTIAAVLNSAGNYGPAGT
jgi:hypothetical protein